MCSTCIQEADQKCGINMNMDNLSCFRLTTGDVSAAGTGHFVYQGGTTIGAAGDCKVSGRAQLCGDHGAVCPVPVSTMAPHVL